MPASECVGGPSTHVVQFYDNDSFLADDVADFVFDGIWLEEGILLIATSEHLPAIESLLQQKRVNPGKALGHYLAVNAESVLANYMSQSPPDWALFKEGIRQMITSVAPPGKRVRVFGEMVAVLWKQGNREEALKLESLWNELIEEHSISLLCGYRLDFFQGESNQVHFQKVCELHSQVIPLEMYSCRPDASDRPQSIALLEQRSISLDAEIVKRKRAEVAVRAEKAKLRIALDLTGMGIWEVDIESRQEFWSAECKSLFNVEPQQGFSCHQMLECVHAQDRQGVETSLREFVDTGVEFCAEFRIRTPSNNTQWIAARGRRLDFERSRLITFFIDVTEKNDHLSTPAANALDALKGISDEKFLALFEAINEVPLAKNELEETSYWLPEDPHKNRPDNLLE